MVRKVLLTLLSVLLLTSVAFAYNANDRVYDSPTKVGDALVFPVFFAVDGVSTDFVIENTNDNCSSVVKVVVRSKKYSQELRDFFIFLTPNDVFRGTISLQNGKPYVSSTDDSWCIDGVCADNVTGGYSYPLVDVACTGDTNQIGYIEAITAYSVCGLTKGSTGAVKKSDLINAWNSVQSVNDNQTLNIITGSAELDVAGAEILAYSATALGDLDITSKLTVGNETSILDTTHNTAYEVEAALAKTNVHFPYYNNKSFGIINFPTKKVDDRNGCDNLSATGPAFDPFNPEYVTNLYDMKENTYTPQGCAVSPCPQEETNSFDSEVNFLALGSGQLGADMGWIRLRFNKGATSGLSQAGDNVTYYGMPSINLVLHMTADGMYILSPSYDITQPTYGNTPVWPFAPDVNKSLLGDD